MLLSNFRKAITSYYPSLKDMVGTTRSNTTSSMTNLSSETPYARINGGSVIVGGGTTEPTFDDYQLEDWIPSSVLKYIGGSVISSSGNIVRSQTSIYQNISDSPVIIREVAMGYNWSQYYNTTPPNAYSILTRSILDTPVTINPGESYAFTYSIEI